MMPTDSRITIEHDGRRRALEAHQPAGPPPTAGWPLVIALHGMGGTAALAARATGWSRKADAEGFVVVYPEASTPDPSQPVSFLRNPTFWNDGSGRAHAGRENVDDVGFIGAVIDEAAVRYPIDRRRVFAAGFSNGASMVFRLGVEMSDRLAAIAAVSGHFWLPRPPRAARGVSLIYLIGDRDPFNPLDGGDVRRLTGQIEPHPPVAVTLHKWREAVGCPHLARPLSAPAGVSAVAYGPGRDDSQTHVHTISGMGHHWPGGEQVMSERMAGPPCSTVIGTDLIWAFWASAPMVGCGRDGRHDP